jgi:hypothetical protein
MEDHKPKHTLCAVRGGQESRNTVVHAINLALEHDARLTFFHVLDAEFLGAATRMGFAPQSKLRKCTGWWLKRN